MEPQTEQFPDEFFQPPKSYWGPGPWANEPDKLNWIDPETGLDCMIVRNRAGNLCGYVGVPESHPWFGVGYSGCINKHEPKTFEQKKADAQKWFDKATKEHAERPTGVSESALECARLVLKPFLDPAKYPTWVDMPRFECLDYGRAEDQRCKAPQDLIEVHGGLTFADACHEGGHICHPKDGVAHEKVWWFGFDCGHYMDYSPGLRLSLPWVAEEARRKLAEDPTNDAVRAQVERIDSDTSGWNFYDRETQLKHRDDEVYKDVAYVTVEVRGLAKQLAAQDDLPKDGPGCKLIDGQVVCS